jgi:predicted porin
LSVSGSTRQNDLDVAFTISIQPGSTTRAAITSAGQENRQAFLTFGDKSWGSVKIGRDLGIFASDAILSDMTLLGVGAPTSSGTTTLGRIGTGYIYADWKSQISYTTPNFNGFQATAGITQAFNATGNNSAYTGTTFAAGGASPAYEGKASYSFAANEVTGKVWVSGIAQRIDARGLALQMEDSIAYGGDIGANISAAGFGLTGYYYGGQGLGTTGFLLNSGYVSGNKAYLRDSDGGYVQATYVLPTKTKVGVSWGISNLDKANTEASSNVVKNNEMWTAGLYHPLTKHLNLVAEYSHLNTEAQNGKENDSNTGSLGAILFF